MNAVIEAHRNVRMKLQVNGDALRVRPFVRKQPQVQPRVDAVPTEHFFVETRLW